MTITFPSMAVNRIGLGLRRTADEPFTADAVKEDGSALRFDNGVLPATDVKVVKWWWPLKWTVDACEGSASDGFNAMLTIRIPPESVTVHPFGGYSTAEEVPGTEVELMLADGAVLKGKATLPACNVPFGGKAEKVVFTCDVEG